MIRRGPTVALGLALAQCAAAPPPATVRFATFNASMNRGSALELAAELERGDCAQARAVAEIVQRVRPDILLLQEIDHDEDGRALRAFRDRYLAVGQHGAAPIRYEHAFCAPVNTGVPSGHDLDRDGRDDGPGDAHGFGAFPGQYGMAVLSRLPIRAEAVRTFRELRWADRPGALWPDDPAVPGGGWFGPAARAVLRLPSKSLWVVPVVAGTRTIHLVASHPTPPVFDGAEDRNGCRNHDEIATLLDLIDPARGAWLRDDRGGRGGLPADAAFVVAGDLNSDPLDGDSRHGAIARLLASPYLRDPRPRSGGGVEQARVQGGANAGHRGDPALDTGDFADRAPGNLRVDYLLPSRGLEVAGAGVFWPVRDDPLFARLIGPGPRPASSDHRLVWVDVVP